MTSEDLKQTEQFYLACLLEAARHGEAESGLTAADFYNSQHGRIFAAIVKQYREGKIPDIITLNADKDLEGINPADIARITDGAWTYANIKYYEVEIKSASKARQFTTALKVALEEINRYQDDTDTVIKNLLPALEGVLATRNESGIKTAAELLETDFPPIRWIIPGLIGDGLTMLVGAPKIGKSWLSLSLGLAAAQGGAFLGSLRAEKSCVLYLALEDTERRLQGRLEALRAEKTDDLRITTHWKDGYIGLRNYLKAHREVNLVIIDTLARFANIQDMNAYSETTNALARIKTIADDQGIAIVVIHHAGKGKNKAPAKGDDWMEAALGSTGLTGATDSTIYIFREREGGKGEMKVTGRDSADQKHPLMFDGTCGTWTIASFGKDTTGDDETDPPKKTPMTPEEREAAFRQETGIGLKKSRGKK